MNIGILGIGNIGTTLLSIFSKYKELFGIKQIIAIKHRTKVWQNPEIELQESQNIKYVIGENLDNIIKENNIDFIFDCIGDEKAISRKEVYVRNKIQACSQGSESGFGVPYIIGINDEMVIGKDYVEVVSCNTHGGLSILTCIGGKKIKNIKTADFVAIRRCDDLSNYAKNIGSNLIARHLDDSATHHGIDMKRVLETIGLSIPITTSDITTPTQLLHSVRFNIEFENLIDYNTILKNIDQSKYIGKTKKFFAGEVFEFGRRYGFAGRLFNHCIVLENNLLIDDKSIKGRAYVPQEGNTILSTISAFLYQKNIGNINKIMEKINKDIIFKNI